MVQVTADLMLAVLRETFASRSEPGAAELRAYFAAAARIIHAQLSDPNLAPKTIAAALQCSRATLYRAFRAHGLTVAGYIREARLQEARRRLEQRSPGTSVAAIAAACGFPDPDHFRRLFRERFDVNPSEVRRGTPVGSARGRPGVLSLA